MRKQRGLSLINLILWAVVVGFIALVGLKLVPVYTEYFGLKSALNALVKEKAGAPLSEVREGFLHRAEIENITSVKADDLDIQQDKSGTSISVKYQKVVPLIANVSLLFDFEASAHHGEAAQ